MEELMTALTTDEWADLQVGIVQATHALQQAFQPDHLSTDMDRWSPFGIRFGSL
jgi:hypothetical protein